jgi:ribose/xylose/arabinose/galactoside ABC-type transport system permease subunit
VAAAGGVLAASLCGLMIGLLVARLHLLPFIVTLGTWSAFRGMGIGLASQTTVNPPATWLDNLLIVPDAAHRWMLVAPGVWVLIALALLVAAMMRYTKFGRHVFAVGSNEQTARLCGVNVARVKILVYTLGAAFAGIAGVLQFSYLNLGDPTTAAGKELDIIAAVVIGGASLSGGQGTVLGTMIGAMLMTVVGNGCNKLGMPNWIQQIITGSIIIVAHALDRLQHRAAE